MSRILDANIQLFMNKKNMEKIKKFGKIEIIITPEHSDVDLMVAYATFLVEMEECIELLEFDYATRDIEANLDIVYDVVLGTDNKQNRTGKVEIAITSEDAANDMQNFIKDIEIQFGKLANDYVSLGSLSIDITLDIY